VRIGSLETEISERSAQVDALTAQLEETQAEKSQLVQQVATINSLLEANQTKQEEDNNQVGQTLQVREWPHAFTTQPPLTICICLIRQVDAAEVEQLKLR